MVEGMCLLNMRVVELKRVVNPNAHSLMYTHQWHCLRFVPQLPRRLLEQVVLDAVEFARSTRLSRWPF